MTTLVLTRRDVAALMAPADWFDAATLGFAALGRGQAASPQPLHLPLPEGGAHAKAGRLDDSSGCWVALKFNLNLPGNAQARGLPTIQGALILCDGRTGRVLALIDSIELTLRRTAAATALAARQLARPESRTLALCGCGAQARPQLEALLDRFALSTVWLWDRDRERSRALCDAWPARTGLALRLAATLEEATAQGDLIVTCTTADSAFLQPDHVRPGTFVAAVGADSPAKSEIAPALLCRARLVTDSLSQCLEMGDLHHAVAAGAMTPADVHAELADLVLGRRPGRRSADEICIFDSTGVAVQDVAAAARVYQRALERGIGTPVEFGA